MNQRFSNFDRFRAGLPSPSPAVPRSEADAHGEGYPAPVSPSGPPRSMLDEYYATIRRHRWPILLCALAGLAISFLLDVGSLPVYRTRTSLDIRNLNGDFLNMRSVDPTGNNTSAESDTNLQTQIKLLLSDTLLEEVGGRLLDEPHPQYIERDDLLSRMLVGLHLRKSEPLPYKALVDDSFKRLKVKPIGLTRLVEITCDSWDPKFSAELCNTLTQTFEQQDLATRAAEAQQTQEWLTKQVADVRLRAEDSQKRLEAAVGGNGLMLSQTTTLPGEDRLRSLQQEYVRAEADRMQVQAAVGVAAGASPDTVPGVQDNPEHRAYELRLAELRGQLAGIVPQLTEENPKVIHLRAQIAEAEAGLRATQASSTGRQGNEYTAALHREQLLQIAIRAQQATVSSDLQKAAQVSLLRRELDSEQQLYQTLLQRAKEAGFASAMQAATIRVVDPGKPQLTPFSPRIKFDGVIGLALGSFFGLGFAFFKERNNKLLRGPGEAARFLHVPELGVIPAAKRLDAKPKSDSAFALAKTQNNVISLTRWNDNFSLSAEAYRNATFSILLADSGKRARNYIVTSPSAGEGKTTITSNLGVALSKSKLRVALIDADLRRPSLHRAFNIENHFGLRNILRGELDLETTPTEILTFRTSIPNIAIIPSGPGNEDVVELLHSSYFGALLARLSSDFDIILIDTPPILHMADARILAGQSDGAILVVRANQTTVEEAAGACDIFDHDGVRLVGTILNDFDPAREGKSGYYKSYYRYQKDTQGSETVGAGR